MNPGARLIGTLLSRASGMRSHASAATLAVLVVLGCTLLPPFPRAEAADTVVKDLSSASNVVVTAMGTHPSDGSVYVVGTFTGAPVTIGTKTLSLAGGKRTGFVAKMASDGGWRWASTLADKLGSGSLLPRAITVTSNNVYICGESTNGIAYQLQESSGGSSGILDRPSNLRAPFVVALTLNGVFAWANMATYNNQGNDAFAYGLAVDVDNNVYVCGSFRSFSIDVNNGTGLNFGPHHAFPSRDLTSTGDFGAGTRDGYVAKLDPQGNWKWVATGGAKEDEGAHPTAPDLGPVDGGFYAVAVDSAKNVYVAGNAYADVSKFHTGVLLNAGITTADWLVSEQNGKSVSLNAPNDPSAFVAKISGGGTQEGKWFKNVFFCIETTYPGQGGSPWTGNNTRPRGLTVIDDQPYVLYQQGPYPVGKRHLVVRKLQVDLSGATGMALIAVSGIAGTNDTSFATPLTHDAAGNLYLSGKITFPGATFVNGVNVTNGTTVTNIVVAGNTPVAFAAKLNANLAWQWVVTSSGAQPNFGEICGAVNPDNGRFYFGGSFSNGVLDLGPSESDTLLPASGIQEANSRSFVTAVDSTGSFLQQVSFTLDSEFGINLAQPPQTPQTVFRGTSIDASVPPVIYEDTNGVAVVNPTGDWIRDRAVVRRTCIGYEIPGTAIAGEKSTYGFTIGSDTVLRFLWKTEYALQVFNNFDGTEGGLTSPAAGNPDPVVQKHWIEDGIISTTFIDGIITSANPNEFGTRYRSTGTYLNGAAAPSSSALAFNGAAVMDLGPRTEYQPGSGPWTVEFWYKTDVVDVYSRRLVSWGNLLSVTQEGSPTSTNLVFASANSLGANVILKESPIATNEWHHLAFVYDGAAWTVYMDGLPAQTQPALAAPGTTTSNLQLGQFFSGSMDEFRIWNRARTASEIRQNYRRTLQRLTEPNLVALWSFDDAASGVVRDLKDSSRSASLTTGVSASPGILPNRNGSFVPWASLQTRQQVPQFLMSSPALVEYRWIKENRLQVSVAASGLSEVPVTVGSGVTNIGSGEFWFTNNARVRVTVPETASSGSESFQLKGFVGGIGNVATSEGAGTKSGAFRYYEIAGLTRGSALTWDYSDRIYKAKVFIGDALNFASGGSFPTSELIPSTELIDNNSPPVSTSIVSGSPAGSTTSDMAMWDDVADKLYPLRPGVVLLEWKRQSTSASTRSIFTEITIAFPTNASYAHIANTPPVPLDQDKTNAVTFLGLKYSQSSKASVSDSAEFSANDTVFSDPFWTVLLFSERLDGTPANGDLNRERLRVRTVLTRKWDNGLIVTNAPIGSAISSSLHGPAVPHNGYVYFENSRYNANLYDRASRLGPIIPVNLNPTAKIDETLVVVWYITQEGIHWPYQSVQYTPQWPSTRNRLVIASRLGSEGVDTSGTPQLSFAPPRYEQVSIYHQPVRSLPGFNPNEEHAFIAPSLLRVADANPPPTVYALRTNLNVTALTNSYTSEPYVLVQYFDNQQTNWNMAIYQVQSEDTSIPAKRQDFAVTGTSGAYVTLGTGGAVELNLTGFLAATGLRTNEVVELEPNNNLLGVTAGRYFLVRSNDNRFLLSATLGGNPITSGAILASDVPRVVLNRAFPYTFEYEMKAGEPVQAPYPLQQIIGATACPATTGENLDANQLVYWEDHKRQPWAVSGSTNPAVGLRAQFYYPLQPFFWHPTSKPGDCIPYVANGTPIWVTNHVSWPANVASLKGGETLTVAGGEANADDQANPGLPGVIAWTAGRVVYDDGNPSMNVSRTVQNYLARLASPLDTLSVSLPISKLPAALQPAGGKVTVSGTEWIFKDLDASLQPRVFYNQLSQKLSVRGFFDGKTLGDPALTATPGSIAILQPNILTSRDSNALVKLVAGAPAEWVNAISNLVRLSRDPLNAAEGGYGVGLAPGTVPGAARHATSFGPGLALLPNAALAESGGSVREGYVTLAENDDPSLGAAPVALHIVRLQKQPLFRGAIKTLNPPNPFDEKVSLRHSGDFGANANDLVFEWYYKPDDGVTVPPPDQAVGGIWSLFADVSGNSGRGMNEISFAGAGPVTLSDNRFFVRWRHVNSPNTWSQWAGAANSRPPGTNELAQNTYVPQLAEGWVKRVTGAVNPFDARITDFRNNNTPATYASMVQQAGAPYRGPVAFNAEKGAIENVGLIELYNTVLGRAKDLSIDYSTPINSPAANNAIILAASRIADLQLLLGNEAYTDAQDPTIGFGTSSTEYGTLAPTIFCFQNQMATLLDEELALLRGRSEEGAFPAYNRLLWNFTRAEGEAAYALSYNIADKNNDGFINEADARIMYPQGHGDAWGHYLTASRTYYDLLRHANFSWQARSETLSIEGVVVSVDYLDERKFAQIAAAKAKAGSEIVNLTYRSRYVEDPDGQWQGYQDNDATRAWGVSDWARRSGCAALYDWVTANAILPASDTNRTGIEKVDRTTVKEIAQISAQAVEIRKQLDNANTGLNPIGLATDVVPFDIDPIGFDPSTGTRTMHFDQVYDRAMKAMSNALDVFNNANQLNKMLRQVAGSVEQFAAQAQEQDLDYRNRLIEIFGTPYEGVIGAGKVYPAGYTGPDLYLYMYVDVTGIQDVPPPSAEFTSFFKPMDAGFVNTKLESGGGNSIESVWSHYFSGDAPSLAANTNTDFSSVLSLKVPQTASGYSFQAPDAWGNRRTPGEVQQVLSELVQAEADLQLALHDYEGLLGDISDMQQLIQAQSGMQADSIKYGQEGVAAAESTHAAVKKWRAIAAATGFAADTAQALADASTEFFPTVIGLATDSFATLRGAGKLLAVSSVVGAKGTAISAEQAAFAVEGQNTVTALQTDLKVQKAEFKYAIQEQLKEFEALLGDESAKRIEVFRKQEALRQVSGKYRSALDTGLRLLEERTLHNKRTAGATQQNRYQDFTFRVARNDALSKYRAAFDLAARYVYLAAKAYDYETNLDPNDPGSARPILTQILRARTLGAVENGEPRLGSGGLADALASLKVNFSVLRSQMGFNNPQGESGQFSLRHELFRMRGTNDLAWRQELEKYRVADLWQLPEFRRFCRPFAPQSAGAQPGLVIPFSSQVVFGKNFFGWPLGPGDSAYDPTLFATKIRSVGVWFDNYAGEGLGTTPRVYLVPAGLDIMYVPNSAEFATREWNVVDQKIPVPLPVSQSNLRDPSWIPLRDSLNGTIAEIRRYSSFRAYHNAGFSQDEMSFDSRLVGRSVWNTRWMLIIPGGTFLSDQTEGLDTFIHGLKSATGTATDSRGQLRDGRGVSDIKISFQTYAISGN